MSVANTIPHLKERLIATLNQIESADQPLRAILEAVASAASSASSSAPLAPSVKALGRFAVDELPEQHRLSKPISEILGIYQTIVRAERRNR